MDDNRRKHGVGFWSIVVLIAMLAGYPLSFGPACWISSRTGRGEKVLLVVYGPMVKAMTNRLEPDPVTSGYSGTSGRGIPLSGPMFRYAALCSPDGWDWWYDVTHAYSPVTTPRTQSESWGWRYCEHRDFSQARRELRRRRAIEEFEEYRRRKRVNPAAPNPDRTYESN